MSLPSRDFRLLYLAPPPQIWLELSPYTTLLEELSVEIAPILTILFSKSVTTGIVPSDWRTAHVSPVYKKGQKYNPENYRPISLTCICCKLLEHLIVKHIMSHADTHNILYPLQHGFRTGRSCEAQLLEFIDDVNVISVTRNKKPIEFDYTLHGHTLDHVTKAEYLGVTISSNLKWGSHINNIIKKANIP